jgi:ribose transport system ATP-binding protein
MGSGRTELAHLLFGVNRTGRAQILFNKKSVRPQSPREAIQLGIGMIPEDRKEQGLITALSVRENITLSIIDELCRWIKIDRHRQNEVAQTQVSQLTIQTPSIHQITQNLSGGNQQKVVLAKWLAKRCQLLIMDEPTRGIDIGAKTEMYKLMNSLATEGKGILLISSDLPEVIAMSDRIYVMRDGRLVAELPGQITSQETIIQYIT